MQNGGVYISLCGDLAELQASLGLIIHPYPKLFLGLSQIIDISSVDDPIVE